VIVEKGICVPPVKRAGHPRRKWPIPGSLRTGTGGFRAGFPSFPQGGWSTRKNGRDPRENLLSFPPGVPIHSFSRASRPAAEIQREERFHVENFKKGFVERENQAFQVAIKEKSNR
jgi:hypothetical protein